MGFESRDYFRDGSYTDRLTSWAAEMTPVVKYLIIVNVVVWLLQIFVTRAPEGPQEPPEKLQAEMQQKAIELEEARRDVARTRLAVKRFKGEQSERDKLKAELEQKEADL